MMNGDVIETRAKHLWGFANLLHMSAMEVDKLRVIDFFNYAFALDEYYKKLEERQREQKG